MLNHIKLKKLKDMENYNELLEKAKKAYKKSVTYEGRLILESLFPELKEGEDERIRKDLLKLFRTLQYEERMPVGMNFSNEKVIAWLEKQGKKSDYNPYKAIVQSIIAMVEKYTNGDLKDFYDNVKVKCKDAIESDSIWLENQGVQHIPLKEMILNVWELGNIWKALTKGICTTEHGTQLEYIVKHWTEGEPYTKLLERQGEPESTDKVEPKFKVGDWCVDNEDGTIFQIVKVLDNTYTYKTNEGKEYSCPCYPLEIDAKLWIIMDAKDGDVLINHNDEVPFIFKGFLNPDHPDYPVAYCGIDDADKFQICSGDYFWEDSNVKPATKEQRDFLFSKMREAGYEWDTEKKELRKQ